MGSHAHDDSYDHVADRDPNSQQTLYFVGLGFAMLFVSIILLQFFTYSAVDDEVDEKSSGRSSPAVSFKQEQEKDLKKDNGERFFLELTDELEQRKLEPGAQLRVGRKTVKLVETSANYLVLVEVADPSGDVVTVQGKLEVNQGLDSAVKSVTKDFREAQ